MDLRLSRPVAVPTMKSIRIRIDFLNNCPARGDTHRGQTARRAHHEWCIGLNADGRLIGEAPRFGFMQTKLNSCLPAGSSHLLGQGKFLSERHGDKLPNKSRARSDSIKPGLVGDYDII